MEACICLTRKIHLHLRALLEEFFVYIYTWRQGHFPILHDNLQSHHIDLSFPLRKQTQLASLSPPHKHHTVRPSSTTNTSGILRHSSFLWSTTACTAFGKCSVPLAVATWRAEQWGFSLPWVDFQVLQLSTCSVTLPALTGTSDNMRGTQQDHTSPQQPTPMLVNGPQNKTSG